MLAYVLMGLLVPARGRIGRNSTKYAMYIIDDADNTFLLEYTGRKVTIRIRDNCGLAFRARLSVMRTRRGPRVFAYLPSAFDPTWSRYYDKEIMVLIEISDQALQPNQ